MRAHIQKILIMCLIVLMLVVIVQWYLQEFSAAMGCNDTIERRLADPGGVYAAFVYRRECGATAPDSIQVNIQPLGEEFNASKYKAVTIVGGDIVGLRWDEQGYLVITFNGLERIYRQETLSDSGLKIRYEAK